MTREFINERIRQLIVHMGRSKDIPQPDQKVPFDWLNKKVTRRVGLATGLTAAAAVIAYGVNRALGPTSNPVEDAREGQGAAAEISSEKRERWAPGAQLGIGSTPEAPIEVQPVLPAKTPEDTISTYASLAFKPAYAPSALPNLSVELDNNTKVYRTGAIVISNFARVYSYYYESPEGVPSNVRGLVFDQNAQRANISPSIFKTLADRYFVNDSMPTGIEESSLNQIRTKSVQGHDVILWEVVWDNKDGTKESRSIQEFYRGETRQAVNVVACRIFKESPLFSKNTCYPEGPL